MDSNVEGSCGRLKAQHRGAQGAREVEEGVACQHLVRLVCVVLAGAIDLDAFRPIIR